VRAALEQAGSEEAEHLAWTEHRIHELGGRKSLLNPLWYGGALAVGLFAGRLGDAWNLGFLAETERQVESHLEDYKARLPLKDRRSWRILERMRQDESRHAHTAARLGARELPGLLKATMRCASRLMTRSSYRI
jgi:ubiquinone biosynthesis monooxygenase Coq7